MSNRWLADVKSLTEVSAAHALAPLRTGDELHERPHLGPCRPGPMRSSASPIAGVGCTRIDRREHEEADVRADLRPPSRSELQHERRAWWNSQHSGSISPRSRRSRASMWSNWHLRSSRRLMRRRAAPGRSPARRSGRRRAAPASITAGLVNPISPAVHASYVSAPPTRSTRLSMKSVPGHPLRRPGLEGEAPRRAPSATI